MQRVRWESTDGTSGVSLQVGPVPIQPGGTTIQTTTGSTEVGTPDGQFAMAYGIERVSAGNRIASDTFQRVMRSVRVHTGRIRRSEDNELAIGALIAGAMSLELGSPITATKNAVQASHIDVYLETNGKQLEVQVTRTAPVDSFDLASGNYETWHTLADAKVELFRAIESKSYYAGPQLILALDAFVLPFPPSVLEIIAHDCGPTFDVAGYASIWYVASYHKFAFRLWPSPMHFSLGEVSPIKSEDQG